MNRDWRGVPRLTIDGHRFGAKAQRWIREKLKRRIDISDGARDGRWSMALQEQLFAWYQARFADFVTWLPWDELTTHSRSTGRWVFCEKEFMDRIEDATVFANAELHAAAYPTLDAWLAADANGLIEGRGHAGGMATLPPEARVALMVTAGRRRATWPRNCTACGESFSGKTRSAKRCASCIASRQQPKALRAIVTPKQIEAPRTAQKLLSAPLPLKQDADWVLAYTKNMSRMLQDMQANIDDMKGPNP